MRPQLATFDLYPGDHPALDVVVVKHLTIWTLTPTTTAGEDWMEDHLPDAPRMGTSRAVERSYAVGIVTAMEQDGIRI